MTASRVAPLELRDMGVGVSTGDLEVAREVGAGLAGAWAGLESVLLTEQGVIDARCTLDDQSGESGVAPDEVIGVPGPAGPIQARVFHPEGEVHGVYLDLHGGGFVLGSAQMGDGRNRKLAARAGCVVVSIDYRLAPEHPYPAAPDDCEAVARWLIQGAEQRFGTKRVLLGGASAGANLAVATLLRLKHDRAVLSCVRGVELRYGPFALDRVGPSGHSAPWRDHYLPPDVDRSMPDVSPLRGDLSGLPPALLSVGELDDLFHDSLLLAGLWAASGSPVRIDVYPSSPHGFDSFPTALATLASETAIAWVADRLGDPN